MAHNKLYRNFIILQEDERGYSHSNDKALSGYAKVEAKGDKCKISFYAQNLRQEDNYSMVLICCKRDLKQLIDIGPLAINEVGKGDTSKEYYVNNIAGLGISYEKISGAAICKAKDNETEFIMHGFMNGEESTDNWRKFKVVKVDSKKSINTLDSELKEKDTFSVNITNKGIISQSSNQETNLMKKTKLQSDLVERKKDENSLQPKVNIESKVEDKQDRIQEKNPNIVETVDDLDEDRHKNKKCEKDDKHGKCEKHDYCEKDYKPDKYEKHDYCEKDENIEEIINKLAKKLDTYDGIIDLKISHHMNEDVIVYGFIKDKKNCNCKWKKFKFEKKCRNEDEEFSTIQGSSKRIEENFKLDKLSEIDSADRLDLIDFDGYENDIQQANLNNSTNQTNTGTNMGQAGSNNGMMKTDAGTMDQTTPNNLMNKTDAGNMGQAAPNTGMNQVSTGTMWQPWSGNGMNQTSTGIGHLDLGDAELSNSNNNQQTTSTPSFNINGDVGQYFEKLAQAFQPFIGRLNDINFCKWYKIKVNGIEDLSDESNYNQYTLAFYPMLNYYPYISKTGHFLLGYKCNKNGEMKYIVYAIPGSKEKKDQPYGGRTGFVTWTNDNKNGQGYWLMFYDFKNSSIVIPTK